MALENLGLTYLLRKARNLGEEKRDEGVGVGERRQIGQEQGELGRLAEYRRFIVLWGRGVVGWDR